MEVLNDPKNCKPNNQTYTQETKNQEFEGNRIFTIDFVEQEKKP
jgi:hypothetical protein